MSAVFLQEFLRVVYFRFLLILFPDSDEADDHYDEYYDEDTYHQYRYPDGIRQSYQWN